MSRVETRREATRAQIVEAAWQLARRDGIAGISLRDIAAKIGMRAPSLYTYVDSKDDIYDEMFADGYRELNARTRAIVEAYDSPVDRFRAATRSFLEFCAEDLARYQLMFTRVVPGWRPSPDAYAESEANYRSMTDEFARVGVTDAEAIDLYTAMISGLAAQQAANDPGGDRYVRLADRALDMFLSHVEHQP